MPPEQELMIRSLRAMDLNTCNEAADLIEQMAQAEPVAVRHNFDGHGWLYLDNGSGSDWFTRHADGEPLYAAPQPAPIPAGWRDAVAGLVDDIDGLIGESTGVYGLHLNGDPSPWDELTEGGRFERLTHLEQVRSMIAAAPQPPDHSEQPLDMVANGIRSDR